MVNISDKEGNLEQIAGLSRKVQVAFNQEQEMGNFIRGVGNLPQCLGDRGSIMILEGGG